MSELSDKLDARLVDLSKRERAFADKQASQAQEAAAKTSVATGEFQPLHSTLLSLASLATNPSGTTPPGLEGVEIQAANRNHVAARVPVATARADRRNDLRNRDRISIRTRRHSAARTKGQPPAGPV